MQHARSRRSTDARASRGYRIYLYVHLLLVIVSVLFVSLPLESLLSSHRTSFVVVLLEFPLAVLLTGAMLSTPVTPFVCFLILILAAARVSRSLAAIGLLDLVLCAVQWLAMGLAC